MLADLQTQSTTKFPESDRQHMFANRQPPPHWCIFIGQYAGTSAYPVLANHASFNIRADDEVGAVVWALQVKTVTMGRLYGAVLVHSPPQTSGMTATIIKIHQPWLIPVQPQIAPTIRFPLSHASSITGELATLPNGGLAMDLATRYVKHFEATAKQSRKVS
jgi:hypothetical protein